MATGDEPKDPKLKLFIRLPRDKFTTGQEETIKNNLFDLLGDTPVKDFEPHINKGYCFLHFEDRLTAAIGHDKIFNQPLQGYTIRPFFGFTRTEQRAVDAGIKDEEIERNHRTLYVKAVPEKSSKESVQEVFEKYGQVVKVNITNTRSSRCAFVLFQKFTPAMQCIADCGKAGIDIDGELCAMELSKNKNLQRRIEKFADHRPMFHRPPHGGMQGFYGGGRGGMHGGGWGGNQGGHRPQWQDYWNQWADWAQANQGGRGGGTPQQWAPWSRGGGHRGGGRGGGRSQGYGGGRGRGGGYGGGSHHRRNQPY